MINKKNMEKQMVKIPNELREWIADHNAFPLTKKIELPLSDDNVKLIFDEINSNLEDGVYPTDRKRLNKIKSQLEKLGFVDHWKGYKYA
tara:strand:- start:2100 stop:2366 length:267 start_codon:yes stop_codon:yes gene_type:complete